MEQFIVSARKYRPFTFDSVVGQSSISTTLKNAIQRKQLAHAYLFCGPRGVGKTTCARIFARTINCLTPTAEMEACGECESCKSFSEGRSYNIHELDAASNNSVEDIRNLTDQVRIPPQIGQYSVYIIDEVHMLSSQAFNAFLKTLEEPPAHAIFVLATTEKHKILPTILSRCQIYDFNRIRVEDIVKHLNSIAEREGITTDQESLNIIAQKADGAMRDALSIFDQVVSFCGGKNVTYEQVIQNLNVLDYSYYFRLTDALLAHNYTEALTIFDEVLSKGFDAQHFIVGLSGHFRDVLVCKDPSTVSLLEVGASIADRYKQQAANCPTDFLFEALSITNACDVGYRNSSNPRFHVELCLIRLSNIGVEKKKDDDDEVDEEPVVTTTNSTPASTPVTKPTAVQASASTEEKTTPTANVAKEGQASYSLKNVFSSLNDIETKREEKQEKQEVTPEQGPANDFTQEELKACLVEFGEANQKKRPRLATALMSLTPTLKEGFCVDFPTVNELQKEAFEKLSPEILAFLKSKLNNCQISLNFYIETVVDDGKKTLYTMDDKLKYLAEKNPAVGLLKQALNLDIK